MNPIHSFGRVWFDRAIPISRYLAQFDITLFIYSRLDVDPKSKRVLGYIIEKSQFVSMESSVPTINASWFFGLPR